MTEPEATVLSAHVKDLDDDQYPESILTISNATTRDSVFEPLIIESSAALRLATAEFFPGGAPKVKNSPLTWIPTALWGSPGNLYTTHGMALTTPGTFIMLSDGNLVVRDGQGTIRWEARTAGNPGAYFVLQDDGNLVILNAAGDAIWDRSQRR